MVSINLFLYSGLLQGQVLDSYVFSVLSCTASKGASLSIHKNRSAWSFLSSSFFFFLPIISYIWDTVQLKYCYIYGFSEGAYGLVLVPGFKNMTLQTLLCMKLECMSRVMKGNRTICMTKTRVRNGLQG